MARDYASDSTREKQTSIWHEDKWYSKAYDCIDESRTNELWGYFQRVIQIAGLEAKPPGKWRSIRKIPILTPYLILSPNSPLSQ